MDTEKIGVVVNDLSLSQLNYYLIDNTNRHIAGPGKMLNVIAFYENCCLPCIPLNFASMPVSELYGYDGTLVTTNLTTTMRALNSFGPSSIFFYLWDLEWIRYQQKRWADFAQIYRNPKIKLLCRSEEHKRVVEGCWNVSVEGVCNDWDYQSLLNVVLRRNTIGVA